MPKVSLNPIERKANKLYEHIECDLRRKQFRHEDVGKWLGTTRQAVDYKMRMHTLTAVELLHIINRLGWDDAEILSYLGREYV